MLFIETIPKKTRRRKFIKFLLVCFIMLFIRSMISSQPSSERKVFSNGVERVCNKKWISSSKWYLILVLSRLLLILSNCDFKLAIFHLVTHNFQICPDFRSSVHRFRLSGTSYLSWPWLTEMKKLRNSCNLS